MKTIFALFLACACALSASSFKNNDVIEHFTNKAQAQARIAAEVKITDKGAFCHVTGGCMGVPTDFFACTTNDLAHTQVGDRVNFMTKFIWPGEAMPLDPWRRNGPEPIVACHRCVWIEERNPDGTPKVIAVEQDRWPWKVEYVTVKNYVSTITLMAVWDH